MGYQLGPISETKTKLIVIPQTLPEAPLGVCEFMYELKLVPFNAKLLTLSPEVKRVGIGAFCEG